MKKTKVQSQAFRTLLQNPMATRQLLLMGVLILEIAIFALFRPGRNFCVSDFRQSQEFCVKIHTIWLTSLAHRAPRRGAAVCGPRAA